MSYLFSLNNAYGSPLGMIDDAWEFNIFLRLSTCGSQFLSTIAQRYYTDYCYGEGELLCAERELQALIEKGLQAERSKLQHEELLLLYKLQAIVLVALRKGCTLWGSGD